MEQSLTQGSAYDSLLNRQPINRYGTAEVIVNGGLPREFSLPSVIRPCISESSSLMTASLSPSLYRNPTLLATITNDMDEQTLSIVSSESYLGGC